MKEIIFQRKNNIDEMKGCSIHYLSKCRSPEWTNDFSFKVAFAFNYFHFIQQEELRVLKKNCGHIIYVGNKSVKFSLMCSLKIV